MQNLLIKNLDSRGFATRFFENRELAVQFLLDLIQKNQTVAFGGSETVAQIGLAKMLFERGNKLFHRGFMAEGQTAEDVMRGAMSADWYISSVNALTEGGELVNTDGRGNRVASTLYGPPNIVFIAGKNKIVKDIDAAVKRVREVAAPLNCKRLGHNHPCTRGEGCELCDAKTSICRATVIYHHPDYGKNVYVVLIDEDLGY